MAVLVKRIKYYPLAQFVCRIGAAWNEFHDYQFSCLESALLSAVLSPALGICMFAIFLTMQPKAWIVFCKIMTCQSFHPNGIPR